MRDCVYTGMKPHLVGICILLSAMCLAQMSRESAEGYVASLNAAPVGVAKADLIWALTAKDDAIVAALIDPNSSRSSASVFEVRRRAKRGLTMALASALPRLAQSPGLHAVQALSKLGGPGSQSAIERAVGHKFEEVRIAAAITSSSWGFKGSRAVLAKAVEADRLAAVAPLGRVGTLSDAATIRKFYDRVKRKSYVGYGPNPPQVALLAMAALREPAALKSVRGEVDRPTDKYFRANALQTLARIRDRQDEPRFLRALKDPHLGIQQAAIEAIGFTRNRQLAAPLRAYTNGSLAKSNAPKNSQQTRRYADHVATCLERGVESMPLQTFNQQRRLPLFGTARGG
jgi:hypothetical protein